MALCNLNSVYLMSFMPHKQLHYPPDECVNIVCMYVSNTNICSNVFQVVVVDVVVVVVGCVSE